VIAVFYSSGIEGAWLAAGAVGLVAIAALQRAGVRLLVPYALLAALTWLAAFKGGIHPTIAGVALGFLTPAVAFFPRGRTGEQIASRLKELSEDEDAEVGEATMLDTARVAREAVSPLARMEAQLHPWTAYLILPVFALANAGVPVSVGGIGDALSSPVGVGIALGLVIGAPLGGLALAWLSVRAGRARVPDGLDWPAIAAVTPLKGIGFTVAIFISLLAFDDPALQEQAKLAILIASAVAGAIGLTCLLLRRRLLR
jgi:NhaA family Na+:H+ antiporter